MTPVYETPSGYVVADRSGWLPGVYATPEAAHRAGESDVPVVVLHTLSERVCSLKGEYRSITMADLDEADIR